jgi:hypothetical protein
VSGWLDRATQDYVDALAKLEPAGSRDISTERSLVSIAISLKRLADAFCGTPEKNGLLDELRELYMLFHDRKGSMRGGSPTAFLVIILFAVVMVTVSVEFGMFHHGGGGRIGLIYE